MFAAPVQMTCEVTAVETAGRRTSVVSVAGAVDWANAADLHAAIRQELSRYGLARLVVDLRGVTHIDSAGLGTLLDGLREANHRDVHFILCGLEDSPRRLLERTRLCSLFDIRPTRQQALGSSATRG